MPDYRGIVMPFVSMGAVTSDDLFCSKEQDIFDFYAGNANRYARALDIGANLGVHSMLMGRNGWTIIAFEPDPDIAELARINMVTSGVSDCVDLRCAAVSNHSGIARFVRVVNNRTGSHLLGAKHAYGPLEQFNVSIVDAGDMFDWLAQDSGLAKIDAEGHEAVILSCLTAQHLKSVDVIVEVGSEKTAETIFNQFQCDDPPLWAQKIKWRRVRFLADMPKHHSEGSLFIGHEPPFPTPGSGRAFGEPA